MIQWQDLFAALTLVLVIEGIMPFVSPGRWRKMLSVMNAMSDSQIRMIGGGSISVGLFLLYVIKN